MRSTRVSLQKVISISRQMYLVGPSICSSYYKTYVAKWKPKLHKAHIKKQYRWTLVQWFELTPPHPGLKQANCFISIIASVWVLPVFLKFENFFLALRSYSLKIMWIYIRAFKKRKSNATLHLLRLQIGEIQRLKKSVYASNIQYNGVSPDSAIINESITWFLRINE